METLGPWFATRSRAAIIAAAQRVRVPIGPVRAPAELLRDPQHAALRFLAPDRVPAMPLVWNGRRPGAAAAAHAA